MRGSVYVPVLLPLVPLIASDEHKGSSDGVWGPGQGMREIGTDQVSQLAVFLYPLPFSRYINANTSPLIVITTPFACILHRLSLAPLSFFKSC